MFADILASMKNWSPLGERSESHSLKRQYAELLRDVDEIPTITIENFLRDPSSFIWFLFGSTWIIIFLIMSSLKRAHYVIVTLTLIFVALISLTTFDGPRVFTLIFLPAFLLLVRAQIVEKYKEEDLISLLGVLALSYFVAPSSLNSWRLLIGYF